MDLVTSTLSKTCAGCTKCCEGYLSANIYGHEMNKTTPCFFVTLGSGCQIYDQRPENPCKSFICEWRYNPYVPEELKPLSSNIMLVKRSAGKHNFLLVVKAGDQVSQETFNHLKTYSETTGTNVLWSFSEEEQGYFGSKEFGYAVTLFQLYEQFLS